MKNLVIFLSIMFIFHVITIIYLVIKYKQLFKQFENERFMHYKIKCYIEVKTNLMTVNDNISNAKYETYKDVLNHINKYEEGIIK